MFREQYMDAILKIQQTTTESINDQIEDILLNHGASEDDSDPEEGYFVTMSDDDIRLALDEIRDLVEANKYSPEKYYQELKSASRLSTYEQGWLDGYEEAKHLR